MKPGYRTTEFWISGVPGILLTVGQALLDFGVPFPSWVGPIMAAIYALSRGIAKRRE
jgi:hypothetical protein